MKKFLKKTEGFTLVELIVVIAILGILAGVAIPAYSGYMKKANETADTTALSAIKTAAVAACATVGEVDRIDVDSETSVKIYVGDTTTADYTLAYASGKWADTNATDDVDVDFNNYMNSAQIDLKYYASAKWYAEAVAASNIAAGWTGTLPTT